MSYMSNSEELLKRANEHVKRFGLAYKSSILHSVVNVVTHSPKRIYPAVGKGRRTEIMFDDCGVLMSATACHKLGLGRVCIVDCGDYLEPGGGFLAGESSQEAMLCHSSTLYNILSSDRVRKIFYERHVDKTHKDCYTDHLLYVPLVYFDNGIEFDIIVCSPPNKQSAMEKYNVSEYQLEVIMRQRLNAILQAASYHSIDVLVLGAFGCGPEQFSPEFVAKEFRGLIFGRYFGCFERVIFSVQEGYAMSAFVGIAGGASRGA